ncbi:hypothetical protein Droror1_Dr00016940 [Drosera rotundifolia]
MLIPFEFVFYAVVVQLSTIRLRFELFSWYWVASYTKVDTAKDVIYVKGKRLPKKLPPKVYLALNKPKGSDQRLRL